MMTDIAISNDISEDYINYLENMDPSLYADITFDYGLTFLNNIYTDIDFTNYENTMMSISGILNTYTSMLQKTDFGSYAPFVTSIAKPFDQSLNNVDYILEQYDIVSDPSISHIPTKENEIMIVLSSDDALTDIVLAELGYYSQDEFFNIVYRANGDDDRYNEDLDKDHFSLDELMNKKFIYYPNDAVFNETPNSLLGPFTYNAYEEDISDTSGKIDLKVTAILKPKEGVSYGCLSSGFYYTETLANRMRKDSANSKITSYIKDHDNVITSSMGLIEMPGSDGSLVETPYVNGITYNYHYYFEGEDYLDDQNIGLVGTMNLTSASGKMINYDLTLEDVGGASLPSSISIYPQNFELKDQIPNQAYNTFMIRFESVSVHTNENGSVVLDPTVNFCFSQVKRVGLLKVTYEYHIWYNKVTRAWFGDVIDSDGWRDLTFSETDQLVKEKKLEELINHD